MIANEREHISKSIAAVTTDSDIGAALTVRSSADDRRPSADDRAVHRVRPPLSSAGDRQP
ncbi:hypothetical protein ACLVWQ_19465 [Streptomyces sp. CWNU-52B]|uniref:hypothetical protein n=1 Tax=unclassified Streptomyces TaxID=2593676 RepID=UPI0039C463EB